MLEFFTVDKPPSPENVLKQLSEFGKCLVTGEEDKLVFLPVDTNPSNFLPSNMSCVSDDIAKKITYTVNYSVNLWGYDLEFDTSPVFLDYNKSIIEMVQTQFIGDKAQFAANDHTQFIPLFEYLTKKHIKGVFKISAGGVSMDNNQFQGFLLREITKRSQKLSKPKSKIISPNLGIVKS